MPFKTTSVFTVICGSKVTTTQERVVSQTKEDALMDKYCIMRDVMSKLGNTQGYGLEIDAKTMEAYEAHVRTEIALCNLCAGGAAYEWIFTCEETE